MFAFQTDLSTLLFGTIRLVSTLTSRVSSTVFLHKVSKSTKHFKSFWLKMLATIQIFVSKLRENFNGFFSLLELVIKWNQSREKVIQRSDVQCGAEKGNKNAQFIFRQCKTIQLRQPLKTIAEPVYNTFYCNSYKSRISSFERSSPPSYVCTMQFYINLFEQSYWFLHQAWPASCGFEPRWCLGLVIYMYSCFAISHSNNTLLKIIMIICTDILKSIRRCCPDFLVDNINVIFQSVGISMG